MSKQLVMKIVSFSVLVSGCGLFGGSRPPAERAAPAPARAAPLASSAAPLTSAEIVGSTDIAPRDVTVRLGKQNTFLYLRGRTASQADRDAMQHAALMFANEAARLASAIPGCDAAGRAAIAMTNLVSTRLGGADYEGKNCRPERGNYKACDWGVGPQGRHYSAATDTAMEIAKCAEGKQGAVKCAEVMPADYLDMLDLRIEKGKCGHFCVGGSMPNEHCTADGQCGPGGKCRGALFELPPNEPFDAVRANAGMLSTRTVIPPLSEHARHLLHATHDAHKAVTDFYCHNGSQPPAGIVAAAHKAYEDDCGDDPVCRHFRQLKRFSGYADPNWKKQSIAGTDDECTFRVMEDAYHEIWMDQQEGAEPAEAPYHRWINARLDGDDNHLKAHLCMNRKDTRKGCESASSTATGCFVVRPVCDGKINNCPTMSCGMWAKQYREMHPAAVAQLLHGGSSTM